MEDEKGNSSGSDIKPMFSNEPIPMLGAMIGFCVFSAGLYGAWTFFRMGPNASNLYQLAIVLAATVLLAIVFIVGARMIVPAIAAPKKVIPDQDRKLLEPLITAGDEKAIDQYVRLSSLSGATGLATKLGLTGLPLITVALTLIFGAVELASPGKGFMDLTKLTLGAFIGSFVQRTATTQAIVGKLTSPP
ncbi:hypothetical protein FJ936_09210 [Mesorhizobium sp. B2-4-13]|uniref:hypothetical protein n=1 Tax=Mesorhizobium sp. B2-4-13 TaxID=2589936 RepID=UPI00114E110F|nr:hypothetical protein [Mesorhizobium sp. B2-4-13]TPK85706.1 hypothetical protein FJ936_09210 [Mesorhizobium sp. B2-4-13]